MFESLKKNHEQALELYKKLAEKNPSLYLKKLAMQFHNLSEIFQELKEPEKMNQCLNEAKAIENSLIA